MMTRVLICLCVFVVCLLLNFVSYLKSYKNLGGEYPYSRGIVYPYPFSVMGKPFS